MRARITYWVVEWRYLLFGVWLIHVFLSHDRAERAGVIEGLCGVGWSIR